MRMGRHVTVIDNPHWQCAAQFPFAVIQGPDFIVYLKEDGGTGNTSGVHPHDIIRPVYKVGEVYLSRGEGRSCVTLTVDDNDENYPFGDGESRSWTRDGRMFGTEEHPGDLMDYAPVAVPVAPIPPAPPATPDPWIGKRVRFVQDSEEGTGTVVGKDDTNYAVRVDEGCSKFTTSGHYCGGLVPDGRGWYVASRNMQLLDELVGKKVDLVIVDEVAAAFDFAVPEAVDYAANVGKRVVYESHAGVIRGMHREGQHYAVEYDTHDRRGLHDCDGLCESGRGWYVSVLDSGLVFERSEAGAQPERSEALSEDDLALCWAAFANHPSIWIDQWVAARRELRRLAR